MQLGPVDGQRQPSKPVDCCSCHVAVQERHQERQPLKRVRGHGDTGTIGTPHLRLERDGEAAVEAQLQVADAYAELIEGLPDQRSEEPFYVLDVVRRHGER